MSDWKSLTFILDALINKLHLASDFIRVYLRESFIYLFYISNNNRLSFNTLNCTKVTESSIIRVRLPFYPSNDLSRVITNED